jgi:hypothetical protein
MKLLLSILLLLPATTVSREKDADSPFLLDDSLSASVRTIVVSLGLDVTFDTGEDGPEQISLAVVDLTGDPPRLGGVHPDSFIYPASVYKLYVAAEVLHQVSTGTGHLWDPVVVRSPNVVDGVKEIVSDPRPLLKDGDTVTVNYLRDLMVTRSDNTAANCLIDLARRENINALLHR